MKSPANIVVVGLGYVGLPLTLAFSEKLVTTGFDNDESRVAELSRGVDRNMEVELSDAAFSRVRLTSDPACLADAHFIVVTVPTPVTGDFEPDLSLLESASALIGSQLRNRSSNLPSPIVVYESTTFPGCTQDFCSPIIERESGLTCGQDFFLGYSPERTNFGDTERTIETVIKVVAGQSPESAKVIAETYGLVAKAGVYVAKDIKTAEASKVIENVQRDLNIALFNELAMIFDRIGVNSTDVFNAAATKWNFHRYKPGLVGGHCIPVDPYYLAYTAKHHGYVSEVILSGRKTNESMIDFVIQKITSLANTAEIDTDSCSVLVLGQTFKEDIADTRNSKAVLLKAKLTEMFGVVTSYDPYLPATNNSNPFERDDKYDVIVVAVGHSVFLRSASWISNHVRRGGVLVDLTGNLVPTVQDSETTFWAL